MERLSRAVQRRTGAAALGLAALVSAAGVRAQPPPADSVVAPGASPAEIVAARELFREGTEDADAGRFAEGLQKFKRVAAVKETAAVRFNLARCEEALGKIGAALADFELAEREGHQDPKAEDVGKLAHDRADALRPRVPRLTLVPPSPPPPGMAVSLDGGKLASATLGIALPIDPGAHVVDATATASAPFHLELTLGPGEAKSVPISLPSASPTPTGDAHDQVPLKDKPVSSSQHTLGWVTLAAGGLFAIGSGIFFILHDNAVSTVNSDCPGGLCPAGQEAQIDGTESNARTYEVLSTAFIAASALAIGTGVVLLATAPKSPATPPIDVTAGAPGAPAGLSLHGTF
ncbi:MAG: hypothetical protein ACLQVI_23775 [Polyangiaceae bacterium]